MSNEIKPDILPKNVEVNGEAWELKQTCSTEFKDNCPPKHIFKDEQGKAIINHSHEVDDNGIDMFKCPACEESEIYEDHNFCPMCGIAIVVYLIEE